MCLVSFHHRIFHPLYPRGSPWPISPLITTILLLSLSMSLFILFFYCFLFYILYMCEIIGLLFISVWLCHLTYYQDSSLLLQMAVFSPFYGLWCSIVHIYMYHILFIQSSRKGHLLVGCFYVLATIKNDAMIIGVHISLQINTLIFFV